MVRDHLSLLSHLNKMAAKRSGTTKKIVATPIAVKPTRIPNNKVTPSLGSFSRAIICQTRNQKTKTSHDVGMRMTE